VGYTYSITQNSGYNTTVPANAGTYWVKAAVTETTNYLSGESDPVSFVIYPAGKIITAWTTNEHDITTNADGMDFTLSRTGTGYQQSLTINVTDSGTYRWTVGAAQVGTAAIYSFDAATKDSGKYNIGLEVTIGGIPHSTIFTITVTD
jgi:hypothetical protein